MFIRHFVFFVEGGRLNEELKYFKTIQNRYGDRPRTSYDDLHFVAESHDPKLAQIKEDEASNSGYQVLIQTAEQPYENILTKDGLLRHVKLLGDIVGLQVSYAGV